MRKRFYNLTITALLICVAAPCFAQDINVSDTASVKEQLRIGICVKKFVGFYLVSGITVFVDETTFGLPIETGVNLTTSYLGTATFSDALPLFVTEIFTHYRFRSGKSLQPIAGILLGTAFTRYKDPAFKNLQQAQALFAPEFGIKYKFKSPIDVSASFGYYLTTGNGKRGLGLMYPLFTQFGVTYKF
jgi:hypothetical protein